MWAAAWYEHLYRSFSCCIDLCKRVGYIGVVIAIRQIRPLTFHVARDSRLRDASPARFVQALSVELSQLLCSPSLFEVLGWFEIFKIVQKVCIYLGRMPVATRGNFRKTSRLLQSKYIFNHWYYSFPTSIWPVIIDKFGQYCTPISLYSNYQNLFLITWFVLRDCITFFFKAWCI